MRFLRLAVLIAVMALGACGDTGIEDPERFFLANQAYLESAVQRLQKSKIEGVWPNIGEAKDYMSPADGRLYQDLRQFLHDHGMGPISVVWRRMGENKEFLGINFMVREIDRPFEPTIFTSFVYPGPGIDPSIFIRNGSCKPLDSAWYLCNWTLA